MLSLFQNIFLLVDCVQTKRMTDAILILYESTSCLCMCKEDVGFDKVQRDVLQMVHVRPIRTGLPKLTEL